MQDKGEKNRGAISSTTELGKMRKQMGGEKKLKKALLGTTQWHKSRHSQLDSNANLTPSTPRKG